MKAINNIYYIYQKTELREHCSMCLEPSTGPKHLSHPHHTQRQGTHNSLTQCSDRNKAFRALELHWK